jgi:hypothetical protein
MVASLLVRRVSVRCVRGITFFCLSLHPGDDGPREGVVIELLLGRCESPVHNGQHGRIISLILALVRQPGLWRNGEKKSDEHMCTVLNARGTEPGLYKVAHPLGDLLTGGIRQLNPIVARHCLFCFLLRCFWWFRWRVRVVDEGAVQWVLYR